MKIGLALAGGGIKGAGHIGVIKALQENDIEIGYIGGTSIGSIVASLFAMGYSTDEMLRLFKFFAKDIMRVNPRYYWNNIKTSKRFIGDGLISGEAIEMAIDECAELKSLHSIQDLIIPIVMPTVDINENKEYVSTNHLYDENFKEDTYIRDISIGKAVRASSSYPGVFAPTIYEGHQFVDGGVIDNLPANEVRKLGATRVLSVRFGIKSESKPQNMIEIALRSLDLIFNQRAKAEFEAADYALTLELPEATVFNIKKIDYCYNIGYTTAIENISKIKEMINK